MISSLDLARLCAVSQGTVDRALHNRPGIGKATKDKILQTARTHGYLPHPAARELLTGERKQVGAIVPAMNSVFFMDLINAAAKALTATGFKFFLTPVNNQAEFLDAVADFSARRTRAILVVPPEKDIHIPDAFVSNDMILAALVNPCTGPHVHFIAPDEKQAGEDGVRYLLNNGHTRIAHLTYPRSSHAIRERARGYSRAMREEGLPGIVIVPVDANSLAHMMETYRPTALFCHNDWLALSAMRTLQTMKVRVPDDVSVLGVDNSPTFTMLCPDITTMEYPIAAIAQTLHNLIDGHDTVTPIGPCRIIERATVTNIS